MNVLARLFRAIVDPNSYATLEDPRTPINADTDDDEDNVLRRGNTRSKVRVNASTTLAIPAIWRGVNLLSRDAAKLGIHIYKRVGKGKEPDWTHPAYPLVRYKPNRDMTAFVFWQTMFATSILRGNAFAYINRDGASRPLADNGLILLPEDTYCARINGRPAYVTVVDGEARTIAAENVLHLKGLTRDGRTGYSVYSKLREALGLALAQEEYAARFFSNAATPSMIIQVPTVLSDVAYARLKTSFAKAAQGLNNAHVARILEQGATATNASRSPQESQLLEGRKFSIVDCANALNVPPHKLGSQERAGYSSLEQENQSYLDDGLDPLLVAAEQEMRDKLLTEKEKAADSHVIEFNRQALVRANLATRAAYYRTATGGRPWMSQNEVRSLENMNPTPDGDTIPEPLNMGNPGGADNQPADPTDPQPGGQPEADRTAQLFPLLERFASKTAARMARRLAVQAERAARKGQLDAWKARAELENAETIADALADVAEAVAELTGRQSDAAAHARNLIKRFCEAEKPDTAEIARQTAQDLLAA